MSSLYSLVSLVALFLIVSCVITEVISLRELDRVRRTLAGHGRQPRDQPAAGIGRSLLASSTQKKCNWYPSKTSTVGYGTCEVNDHFILTMQGAPPSYSSRILAYMSYRAYVCGSYSTRSACLVNASDACAWDRMAGSTSGAASAAVGGDTGGGCYLSASALYDAKVLRDRLYCKDSFLDVAARCALALPGFSGCAAAGLNCTFITGMQLAALGSGGGDDIGGYAAMTVSYLKLVDLVTFTDAAAVVAAAADAEAEVSAASGEGVCMAGWLLWNATQENLNSSTRAHPEYGILQQELLGSCNGTEWLVKMLADATVGCAAAAEAVGVTATAANHRTACEADTGCRWDAASSTCMAEYFWMYRALYNVADPWIRDLRDAASDCDTATTRRECEADGAARSFTVDADRISRLQYALTDSNWNLPHLPDGGDGAALAMRSRPWLMLIASSAAVVLLSIRWNGSVGSWL